MLFNTPLFVVFFVGFWFVFQFVARSRTQQLWAIIVGSAIFYSAWDARCLPLLFGVALFDFYIARAIDLETREPRRKLLLAGSMAVNIGALSFFKYTNFFASSLCGFLSLFGIAVQPPVWNIVLPIGISFYTFQSMSYTIDVYRRQLSARRRPTEYLAAVSFFPHLVAGPIVRASTLLPQFETFGPASWKMFQRGWMLVAAGAFKKSLADVIALKADSFFAEVGVHSSALDCWTGVLSFAAQIYCDFSGYTDIAIGISALLGFTLPINFNLPFLATSPPDFWRRWHVSLSNWLRDYLYYPLSLANPKLPYGNLIITMALAGLWHGARWTYVLFGVFHGTTMAITHWLEDRLPPPVGENRALKIVQVAVTFYLTLVGFVLFRAESFAKIGLVLRGMHFPLQASAWTANAARTLALVVAALVGTHLLSYLADLRKEGDYPPAILWPAVVGLLAIAMAIGRSGQPFIYFQF